MIKRIVQILKSEGNSGKSIPNLKVSEFKALFNKTKNAVLLDVRTAKEVSQGKIEGAINIDFFGKNFQKELEKLDPTKFYFVYCRSGKRSMNSCKAMIAIGIENAVNLDGGYLAYAENQ